MREGAANEARAWYIQATGAVRERLDMDATVAVMCVVIAGARICDISLDTVRTVAIIQGRRRFAAVLGFFEALIYIAVVAGVLLNVQEHPIYMLAYAVGFAAGTYLGIVIEQRLAFGEQLVAVFTRKDGEMVGALRGEGFRVTEVGGQGRDGPVTVLYIEVARRDTKRLTRRA
ncbi:MAG: DUF5698 domain-containing protein, partial [Planctomycetota bacterium]|nr:DUF5698 domain-containing protein [Planctomycetota bacterium]